MIRLLAVTLMVGLFGLTGVAAVRVGAEPRDRFETTKQGLFRGQSASATPRITDDEQRTGGSSGHGRVGLVAERNVSALPPSLYRNHSAAYWAWRFRARTRQLQNAREQVRRRWHPTVDYALRLASSVSGVSYWQLREVSWCESTYNPFAQNGKYKGIFQLGWRPFGFSPYDPVASALSAALTVKADGSWRQWSCKP